MSVEFTKEQLDYVGSSIEEHIFLEACPGSGKTEVVAAKVAKEINSWKKNPGGLAALSFSNSATEELTIRVSKYLPHGRSMFPHFLGTFDSFIYKNIVSPLSIELTRYVGESKDASIRIIEPSALLGYKTQYHYAQRGQICAHHYSLNLINENIIFETGDSKLDRALNAIQLEDWQVRDLKATKIKMLGNGFATYRDIECLALEVLSGEKYENFVDLFVRRYPLIIIDECQDLSEEQLIILQVLSGKGTQLHFIGDLHQAIYSFRGVDPAKVSQFIRNNCFTSLKLTRNFRSCQNIINICTKLTKREEIIGNVSWLDPRCLVVQYNNCPTELVEIFEEKCNGYNNNVVVARGHSTLSKFQASTTNLKNIQKLALAIKLYDPKDMEAMNLSLWHFSEFIRYHLKESYKPNSFNCPQSVDSSLMWRRFLYESLSHLINNSLQKIDIDWSNWVKKAKMLIQTLPKQSFCHEDIARVLTPLEKVNLRAPSGEAKSKVSKSLGATAKPSLLYRKSTIHGAKGETHDITIVISSDRAGNDSHWKSWLKNPNSEAARFSYVASSRPKEYLIWAVKTLKPEEKEQLKGLGFTIV
ncbi:UvrD-helicase domain-containing protein [Oceanospirillum beijerinckii]|uniref:UvrD-helicase domain-containing protein n=1 Tax=Oceanospirillum beijerinckii TaxID=64976 RepID=UPI00042406F1|nr:UvrD-helicase domain-containing protein [Oceanospirillum beijerinckii]